VNMTISEIFSRYIREVDGLMCFLGDSSVLEHLNATMILARTCKQYREDVDEELFIDEVLTCYNCRFRRWAHTGFSCHKGFPVG
jgi:hypothetical protein